MLAHGATPMTVRAGPRDCGEEETSLSVSRTIRQGLSVRFKSIAETVAAAAGPKRNAQRLRVQIARRLPSSSQTKCSAASMTDVSVCAEAGAVSHTAEHVLASTVAVPVSTVQSDLSRPEGASRV